MKKNAWKILVALILIFLYVAIRPVRTQNIMKSIAENEFEDIPMYDTLRKQLKGPVISDRGKYLEFEWYKILEWEDTAAMHIAIYKRPSSFSWRDDFYWPRVTMNYHWYYFLFPEGTSKFGDILPDAHEKKIIDSSKYKPYRRQNEMPDSINFTVTPNRLFYFLQKGYFTAIEKNETYTIVNFYEPIANIVHKHTRDTISTMSAKVFFNDSLEVLIMPYDRPLELRNKK